MNAARFFQIARTDYAYFFRRPMFWVWIALLGLTAWGLSTGDMRIASGDANVGGTKAWLTSEFSMAMMLSMVIFIFYMFFIAISSGMSLIRDHDLKVGEVLHSTPLTPREYVWGKFSAGIASFLTVMIFHIALAVFFNHLFPNPLADEVRGPFNLLNYVRPAVVFGLPPIIFLAGTTFAIGTWIRKPILVFLVPIALLFFVAFFLWSWSPHWLDPRINQVLMLVEPSGFRWLNETWLSVDRGVDFYNTAPIGYDAAFLLSRLVIIVLGLLSVVFAERQFVRQLRGASKSKGKSQELATAIQARPEDTGRPALLPSLATLGMRSRPLGFFGGAFTVARFEFKELISSPGLYLFIPIILVQVINYALFQEGPFDTKILFTSGLMAVGAMNTITLLVCLLLLFYTVESLQRERNTGLASIYYTSRLRTASMLFGKALANGAVGGIIILASFLSVVVALLIQGRVGLSLFPFIMTWGLIVIPTLFAWTGFVFAVQAVSGNRYTTYAVGLGVLILTGYLQQTGRMTWVGNWDAWAVVRWTDFGTFELNRVPLFLNRLLVLSLLPFFIAFTVQVFDRTARDATRLVHRFRPGALLWSAARLVPFLILPLATGIVLGMQVQDGFQSKAAEKAAKDYWRGNIATWKDAPLPVIVSVDVDVELKPSQRQLTSRGSYLFKNHRDHALASIPLSAGKGWKDLAWTLNGETVVPDEKAGLYVFTPSRPLEPGERLTVGWSGINRVPSGITRNGGGVGEFILPMGTVLTSFSDAIAPVLGYNEDIGVDKDNRYDAREYPDNFHEGVTGAGFGSDIPFRVRTRVTAPEEYRVNGVGTLVAEETNDGMRTVVWETEHPVNFFNIVAGRWEVRRGEGTAVFHHPDHTYNLDEIVLALDGARKFYSEWFYEFPWQELKVSEFANLDSYAQGFATNITFSEGIGFLTKSDANSNTAFMVTAHEAAHQWWGNILLPGEGPGGNILSEGMAHFSTALLFEEMKGPRGRIPFLKNIEDRYGEKRRADSERPLVKIDGSRPGDNSVTYDKGGWVFWMLLAEMGRENALAGTRDFIHRFSEGPDHALLQDYVAVMREHADDKAAFDHFTGQWFFDVVVPEYVFHDAERREIDGMWEVTARLENRGTGRMTVEVAALRGERFPKEKNQNEDEDGDTDDLLASASGEAAPSPATEILDETDTETSPRYQEARTSVFLGPGESANVTITCDFEPEELVVDPDVMVLQLNRKNAIVRF